jgi:hypothetical protein
MTLEECADLAKSVGKEYFMYQGEASEAGPPVRAMTRICKTCEPVSDKYFDDASAAVDESIYRV